MIKKLRVSSVELSIVMSMISHMSHIWNYCDLCENLYVADTIRRQVKPIHKDWNICDHCENFYVADTIRGRVKSIHKNQKDFICNSSCQSDENHWWRSKIS